MAAKKTVRWITTALIVTVSLLLASVLLFLCLALKCVYDDSYKDAGGTFLERVQLAAGELFDEEPFDRLLSRMKYKYFGRAGNDTIFLGKEGFLFSRTGEDGFSFESDFHGGEKLDAARLEKLCAILTARKRAYANDNIRYSLYVIPNSQVVYDDMTGYGQYEEGNARAEDACLYVSSHTTVEVHYLREALKEAAATGNYPVYDNTENTLNAYGAYVVYRTVCGATRARGRTLTPEEITFDLWKTSGRTYARELGIEKTLQNKSVVLRTDLAEHYEIFRESPAYSRTRLLGEYEDPDGVSSVLFDIGSEREYSLFYPYFASTYTVCLFKPDYFYSRLAVNSGMITDVVQILREDEFLRLFDEEENESFYAGGEGDDPDTTSPPEILGNVHLDPEHILILGEAENGAVIRYTLDDETMEDVAKDGRFFITVQLGKGESFKLKITAQSDDKAVSPPIYTSVSYDAGAARRDVISGRNGTLHYSYTLPDYLRSNAYTEEDLQTIADTLSQRLAKIRSITGKETKQIILIAPSPLTVRPDNATEDLKELRAGNQPSRLEQLLALYAGDKDTVFLDIASVLKTHSDEKLYYQTDTHWTDLGAYYAYRTLMRYIAEERLYISPVPLDSLRAVRAVSPGGDLLRFLSLDQTRVTERVTYLVPTTIRSDLQYVHPETVTRSDLSGAFYTHVADEYLPSAVFLRDSFSAAMIPYLSEHFECAYFSKMWSTSLDEEILAEVSPDYVICIFAERNIDMAVK